MRKSRTVAGILLALAALALFVAGPIMVAEGVHGQNQVRTQLTNQKITFPAKGDKSLPANLQSYGGQTVITGPQAKAYADMVEVHVRETTGGKTYSEVSAAWMAGGMKDATLAQQRQTAFMGESLRASLMSAYQAWELSWLVIGLGVLLFGLSVVFGATAWAIRPQRVRVPESPEVLQHQELTTS
ncbi:hypothetical protein [Rugosimonospora africana]|uniref:Aromatic ring-opening dioxygenase LigA n=1 Tax=Rugosimonospora africana TaxID=556532 RepID=A0A8J3R6V4_9ACTN|nr:hypothetical protein [Rugosimonospora africana]GIH21111.1 hypothetical protein Raf01_92830 [Rugosimonospora africana]